MEEKYQFSEKGDIVMIDDEIVDEYEDDYIDGSEEDDENDLNEESKHFKENNKTASVEVVHEWQNHIQQ